MYTKPVWFYGYFHFMVHCLLNELWWFIVTRDLYNIWTELKIHSLFFIHDSPIGILLAFQVNIS